VTNEENEEFLDDNLDFNLDDYYTPDYDIEANNNAFIDEETNEIIDQKNLTKFQQIKLISQKLGLEVNNPNKSCRDCNGVGVIGVDHKNKRPIPCPCIYSKEDRKKNRENFQNNLTFMNRRMRRKYSKQIALSNKKRGSINNGSR